MTAPWSPMEIEERLRDLSQELSDAVLEYKSLGDRAARAKVAYGQESAKALLRSKIKNADRKWSVDLHKAWAVTQTEKEALEHEIASTLFTVGRQVLDSIRAQLEVCRTLLVQSRGLMDPRH